jgi:pimeloyl-ACP methyl ester carboxylesterase
MSGILADQNTFGNRQHNVDPQFRAYAAPMARSERLDLDVGGLGPDGVEWLAAELIVPDGISAAPLLVCFPGGGMTRRYFDLPEEQEGEWSMARHLADHFGIAVAVIDHPGVGDSSVPEDPYTLNPTVVAAVDHGALSELVAHAMDLFEPTRLIGLGHSMGGLVVAHAQWHHRSFDAVAFLGFGGAGLPEYLTKAELSYADNYDRLEPVLAELVRERFGTALVSGSTTSSDMLNPGTLSEAREILATASGSLLALCGLASMVPGSSNAALASIEVPVFIGLGENDIAGDIGNVASLLTSSGDVTTYVLAGAGHNHSISRNRTVLWDALGNWIAALDEQDA